MFLFFLRFFIFKFKFSFTYIYIYICIPSRKLCTRVQLEIRSKLILRLLWQFACFCIQKSEKKKEVKLRIKWRKNNNNILNILTCIVFFFIFFVFRPLKTVLYVGCFLVSKKKQIHIVVRRKLNNFSYFSVPNIATYEWKKSGLKL